MSVVLLHGFTGTPRVWDTVADDLRRDHDVHALPIAGHRGGRPVPAKQELSIDYFADVLADDFERAGLDRPHLVGNSMGGWIALELAARGLASSVYALCPAGFWKGADDPLWAEVQKAFHTADADARRTRHLTPTLFRVPQVRRFAFRKVARRGDRLSRDAAIEAVTGVLECTAYPRVLEAAGAGAGAPCFEALGCPVAVRLASHDRLLPLDVVRSELARRVPEADVGVLRGVGHIPMIDDPLLVAEDVRAWLRTATTVTG